MKTECFTNGILYNGDCLKVMDILIADEFKIDAIIADPPYGILNRKCQWDDTINLDLMWNKINRLKANNKTPTILFSQEPYTSKLIFSNLKDFKYKWYWEKTSATGFLNANKQPLRCIEEICVFYNKQCIYNPQKSYGHAPIHNHIKRANVANKTVIYGNNTKDIAGGGNTDRYPKNLITFKSDKQTCYLHPTQKPVALMEYLIKTYTNEEDLILDFTAGSGTTLIACQNLNRKFIGIEFNPEKDKNGNLVQPDKYFNIAVNRLRENEHKRKLNEI